MNPAGIGERSSPQIATFNCELGSHTHHDTNLHHQSHYIIIITNFYLKCSSVFVLCSIAEEADHESETFYDILYEQFELRSRIAQQTSPLSIKIT